MELTRQRRRRIPGKGHCEGKIVEVGKLGCAWKLRAGATGANKLQSRPGVIKGDTVRKNQQLPVTGNRSLQSFSETQALPLPPRLPCPPCLSSRPLSRDPAEGDKGSKRRRGKTKRI